MDFELLPNVFFVSLYKMFLKYTINYTKLYNKKNSILSLVMGRVVMGWVVPGASFPWGELSWGELSMRQVVHGASGPWAEMSMGRDVHGASCPWGELSMGRVVHGASCLWGEMTVGWVFVGRVSMGRVVWEPGLGESPPAIYCFLNFPFNIRLNL